MRLFICCFVILISSFHIGFSADFKVTIDGRNYLFADGIQQEIILAEGKSVAVKVEGVEVKRFQKHGVSFDYPPEIQIEEESADGIQLIYLDWPDSEFAGVYIFPLQSDHTEFLKELADGTREEIKDGGGRSFSSEDDALCTRSFGGKDRMGIEHSYSLLGVKYKCEFYAFKKNEKTIAVMLQYAVEDKVNAMREFEIVSKSFK